MCSRSTASPASTRGPHDDVVTATPLLDMLYGLRLSDAKWRQDDRPVLVAGGQVYGVRDLDSVVEATEAYAVGVNQHDFERLVRYLRTSALTFYEMRVERLSSLARLGALTMLAIEWNTKLTSLEPVGELSGLEILSIVDAPKARDLTPIARLARLCALDFSGGIWTKNTVNSREPIGQLGALEELRLTNLRVLDGGLRPLSGCRALRRLDVSNQFETADYAYLSVALPDTECDHFAPYVPLQGPIGGKDVMVVGSRKPFLVASKDAARIQRYVDEFRKLQEQAAAELARVLR